MMLQYALEREVTEALGRNYYENAPATTKEKGRRNGYESHRVLTGEGAVTVQVPRVRETEKVFQSKILDAYVSRTEKLDEHLFHALHRARESLTVPSDQPPDPSSALARSCSHGTTQGWPP